MRLAGVTNPQLDEWRAARLEAGQKKYGDAHLERYNLVDVVEELLDAQNIVHLLLKRLSEEGNRFEQLATRNIVLGELEHVFGNIDSIVHYLQWVDERLPDSFCNDARGGERVWWSEERSAGDGAE